MEDVFFILSFPLQQSVCALADVNAVFPFELREGLEVFSGHLLSDFGFVSGVDERHATSLETCSAEASAVDAVGVAHDVVEHLQFRRTRLPVADAALSAFETEAAIRLEVATTPSFGTSLYAVELRVPVLGTLPPVLRQAFLVLLVYLARHGSQVCSGNLPYSMPA